MRDLFFTASQIGNNNPIATGRSSLIRYYRCDSSAFTVQTDYSQYARNSQSWGGYNASAPGLPAPGFLMNQHSPTVGACFQGGHGFNNLFSWNGNQDSNGLGGHYDDFTSRSWSLVFAGIKPHDMSVNRTWHGIGSGSDVGGTLQINTDGSLTVTSNVANPQSSASGVIQQYVPHLIVISYDNSVQKITVYVGDWNGRWVTAINAASAAAITTSAPFPLVGRSRSGSVCADGFLDDYFVYSGHAVTASEAQQLFVACGYMDSTLDYTTSPAHRAMPFNQAYTSSAPIDSNSAAAVTEFANKATTVQGGGAFNPTSSSTSTFTTSTYIVSGSFRRNPANWTKMNGPSHYGDQTQIMCFEDCPVPFNARPSLGFSPSNGSDSHFAIWCPDTDEYWEGGGSGTGNTGTDAAPNWVFVYGGKANYFSAFLGAFGNAEGATATGVPNMLGVPLAADLQNAIYNGVPLKHGLAAVMYDGLQTQVWPANRHDGSKASGSSVIEGQTYRLKHDAATTALIAAMPHPTGRAMAQAAQTYGITIVDRNLFATLLLAEDFHSATAYNGGVNPYTNDPAGKPALGGILNGQRFSSDTMASFPWANLELLDATKINPADPSQPVRPIVTGISGVHLPGSILVTWPDDLLVTGWKVYQRSAFPYTLASGITAGVVSSLSLTAPETIPAGSMIVVSQSGNTYVFYTSAAIVQGASTMTVKVNSTTVSSASNGVNVSTFTGSGTLNVANANAPILESGWIQVATSAGTALISYTGTTSTAFTGCTLVSGSGTVSTNGSVQQACPFTFTTAASVKVYDFLSSTSWPKYVVTNPISSMTFVVTAVNGGGETYPSLDFTPPLPIHTRRRPRGSVG